MAESESIAAAYEGFTKDIDKLQQIMIKGEEMEERIKQRKKKVDEEIESAFNKVGLELDKRKKVLHAKSSHTALTKRKRLSLQCKELSELKKAMEDCHKPARAAKSHDDWSGVDVEAEHVLTKVFEISLGAV